MLIRPLNAKMMTK